MFIYRFKDIDGNILYVGKTIKMRKRMLAHFKTILVDTWKNRIDTIEFAKVKNEATMNLYEMYYINVYKPIHNKNWLFNGELSVSLPELNFIPYKEESIEYLKNPHKEHTRPDKFTLLSDEEIEFVLNKNEDNNLRTIRDRMILLLGFTTGLLTKELQTIKIEELEFQTNSIVIKINDNYIKINKNPQNISCCVESIKKWLETSKLKEGYLIRGLDRYGNLWNDEFLSDKGFTRSIHRLLKNTGMDIKTYGMLSLRNKKTFINEIRYVKNEI